MLPKKESWIVIAIASLLFGIVFTLVYYVFLLPYVLRFDPGLIPYYGAFASSRPPVILFIQGGEYVQLSAWILFHSLFFLVASTIFIAVFWFSDESSMRTIVLALGIATVTVALDWTFHYTLTEPMAPPLYFGVKELFAFGFALAELLALSAIED